MAQPFKIKKKFILNIVNRIPCLKEACINIEQVLVAILHNWFPVIGNLI